MSDKKSELSFGRRQWDKDEYARVAYEKRQKRRGVGVVEDDEKTTMKKYDFYKKRLDNLQQIDDLNKISLVSLQAADATGKRGKSVGFYCDVCNLTFKNNLEFIEHLNSKQHYSNSGFDYEIENNNKDITLEMIIDRVTKLKQLKDKEALEKDEGFNLKKRIEMRKIFEEKEKERTKQKQAKKRQKLKQKKASFGGQQ
ncbi:hypothetical protein PACTADRAFT_83465 [Pachysolen tannophilus NRRL Y-2460]|uniref:C2H2-type domain-containing protein n=1 Tax=Pachysolen tannophilus NRRL Y-2460 TaxID=669874 RepID=A0A1E4U2B0_PACTA|nr:hypothetical protein PACTADRAFT_83465 [Pachysolen tannophilus NRRL Y-2460]